MKRRAAPGFTLIELVLALTIVAILVTMLFGGLRVGLRAWQRGEERATALQHARSMRRFLEDALAGTYWYLGQTDQNTASPALLFKGDPDRVSFVTVSPPLPLPLPIPFMAVTLSMDAGNAPGLAVREKALPNFDPFEEVAPSVVDPTIASIGFRYLRAGGDWQDTWDGAEERALPQAVEVTVTPLVEGRVEQPPPVVIMVPIRVNSL